MTRTPQHLLGNVRPADVRSQGRRRHHDGIAELPQSFPRTTSGSWHSIPAGVESIVMSFIVNRPKDEPGFGLTRQEAHGRRFATRSQLCDGPP